MPYIASSILQFPGGVLVPVHHQLWVHRPCPSMSKLHQVSINLEHIMPKSLAYLGCNLVCIPGGISQWCPPRSTGRTLSRTLYFSSWSPVISSLRLNIACDYGTRTSTTKMFLGRGDRVPCCRKMVVRSQGGDGEGG